MQLSERIPASNWAWRWPELRAAQPAAESDAPVSTAAIAAGAIAPAATWRAWWIRPRRVLFALAGVWILGLFDLCFTLIESVFGHFVEVNPIAARLLSEPMYALVVYKFGLVGLGTMILLSLRRHAVAELGCWFLLATHIYVIVRWHIYYGCVVSAVRSFMLTGYLAP